MKSRGAEIHGLLLVAALGAAWLSWTADDDEPASQGEVTLWDLGGKGVVTAVHWEAEGRKVALERKKGPGGAYVWGTTERERKAKPASQPTSQPASQPATPPDKAAAAPEAKPEPEPEAKDKGGAKDDDKDKAEDEAEDDAPVEIDTKVFRANDRALELLDSLAKPKAKRSLGPPTPEQLEELKLKAPEGVVTVTAGGKTKTLQVGMMAYGGGLRYVRDAEAGVAYVVEAKLVDDLKWADSRLVERALHTFKAEDVTTFTVTSGGAAPGPGTGPGPAETKSFTRETDDTAATWLGKLFRLRADRYVAEGEKLHNLEGDDVQEIEVAVVKMKTHEGAGGELRLTRFGEGTDARWYAVTERTGGRVGVSRYQADEVAKDLDGLFPSESTPDSDEDPAPTPDADPTPDPR